MLPGRVIPAKAGIYSASHGKFAADGLDSRFRGNDQCFVRDPIPPPRGKNFESCFRAKGFSARERALL
jgi:hypothetical protein